MNNAQIRIPKNNTRIGFHYFPDTVHYRDIDLRYWLPELKSLNTSWLVLESSLERAIPENFISSLVQANIEPIIHFKPSISADIVPEKIAPILTSYQKWGAQKIIFFDQPNNRMKWADSSWAQKGLIESFIKVFLPLANCCIENKLIPLIPPLQPGGNYWDTAFLKSLLLSLKDQYQSKLLENLILTCYSWSHYKNLNWGTGGHAKWSKSIPYATPEGEEDHQGFRIFEWYTEISKTILNIEPKIILLGAGIPEDPLAVKNQNDFRDNQLTNCLPIGQLLHSETVQSPDGLKNLIDIPDNVLAGNFWQLSASGGEATCYQSWYQTEQQKLPIVQSWKNWVALNKEKPINKPSAKATEKYERQDFSEPNIMDIGKPDEFKDKSSHVSRVQTETNNSGNLKSEQTQESHPKTELKTQKINKTKTVFQQTIKTEKSTKKKTLNGLRPIAHYLLLPNPSNDDSNLLFEGIQPFIKKHKPTIGFSLKEAVLAKRVTVIGSENCFPKEILDRLSASGCKVDRVLGSGTNIATELSTR